LLSIAAFPGIRFPMLSMLQSVVPLAILVIHALHVHVATAAHRVDHKQMVVANNGHLENVRPATHRRDGRSAASSERDAGNPDVHVSVNVNLKVHGAEPDAPKHLLLTVDDLQPARENLHDSFKCYDKDGNKVVLGEVEMQDLQRHVVSLVSSRDTAAKLMQEADFRGGEGLDEIEFGVLLDLICWHLNVDLHMKLASGRQFVCHGDGIGRMGMLETLEGLRSAHADLDYSFKCVDRNGDGELCPEELAELSDHLKTGLQFSNELVAGAIDESNWGKDGFQELQFDCLLMKLQNALDDSAMNLDVH